MVAEVDCNFCLSHSAKIIIFIGLGNCEKKDTGYPSRCPTTNPRQDVTAKRFAPQRNNYMMTANLMQR